MAPRGNMDRDRAPSIAAPTGAPLAHLDEFGRPHLLIEHLESVAALAGQFAARFGAGEWAALAGRWHDLGKYAADFQYRIRKENGFAAHLLSEMAGERDHSSAGALHAWKEFGPKALPIAFAIAGHHAGRGFQPVGCGLDQVAPLS
jgi:CRISPR-associated endonuclease/helicase Cas3